MGQLTEQFIRARAKPFIVEVDQQTEPKETSSVVVEKGCVSVEKINTSFGNCLFA